MYKIAELNRRDAYRLAFNIHNMVSPSVPQKRLDTFVIDMYFDIVTHGRGYAKYDD